jgi:hypothetical protein
MGSTARHAWPRDWPRSEAGSVGTSAGCSSLGSPRPPDCGFRVSTRRTTRLFPIEMSRSDAGSGSRMADSMGSCYCVVLPWVALNDRRPRASGFDGPLSQIEARIFPQSRVRAAYDADLARPSSWVADSATQRGVMEELEPEGARTERLRERSCVRAMGDPAHVVHTGARAERRGAVRTWSGARRASLVLAARFERG